MTKEFMKHIPSEKKELKFLKFNCYLQVRDDLWVFSIEDPRERIFCISSQHSTNKLTAELECAIEAFRWLYAGHAEKYKRHIRFFMHTSSIYLINLLREWLKQWKENNFADRPRRKLLVELADLAEQCHVETTWIPEDHIKLRENINHLSL
jgi:ribonuclease HI